MDKIQEYANLVDKIKFLQYQQEQIKQDVIEELETYKNATDSSSIDLDNAKVTLQYRRFEPKPTDDSDLDSIQQDIDAEIERLERLNKDRLQALRETIEDAQAQIEHMMSSHKLNSLRDEYRARVDAVAEYRPIISVRLKGF